MANHNQIKLDLYKRKMDYYKAKVDELEQNGGFMGKILFFYNSRDLSDERLNKLLSTEIKSASIDFHLDKKAYYISDNDNKAKLVRSNKIAMTPFSLVNDINNNTSIPIVLDQNNVTVPVMLDNYPVKSTIRSNKFLSHFGKVINELYNDNDRHSITRQIVNSIRRKELDIPVHESKRECLTTLVLDQNLNISPPYPEIDNIPSNSILNQKDFQLDYGMIFTKLYNVADINSICEQIVKSIRRKETGFIVPGADHNSLTSPIVNPNGINFIDNISTNKFEFKKLNINDVYIHILNRINKDLKAVPIFADRYIIIQFNTLSKNKVLAQGNINIDYTRNNIIITPKTSNPITIPTIPTPIPTIPTTTIIAPISTTVIVQTPEAKTEAKTETKTKKNRKNLETSSESKLAADVPSATSTSTSTSVIKSSNKKKYEYNLVKVPMLNTKLIKN